MTSVSLISSDDRSVDFDPDILRSIPDIAPLIESGEAFSEPLVTDIAYRDLVEYRKYLLGQPANLDAVLKAADELRDDSLLEDIAFAELGPDFEAFLQGIDLPFFKDLLAGYKKVPLRVINSLISLSEPEPCIFI